MVIFQNKKQEVSVVAGIIENGKILLIKRKESSKYEAGKWGLPGGTMEYGESPEQTLMREMQEEINVEKVDINKLTGAYSKCFNISSEQKHVVLLVYICKLREKPSANKNHIDSIKWVDIDKIQEYDIIEGSEKFLKDIIKWFKNQEMSYGL